MKYLLGLLMALLAVLAHPAYATQAQTAGQVKLELLKQLEQDGYLSSKLTNEAKVKYVDPRELATPLAATAAGAKAEVSLWDQYVSWTNFFKVVGVALLLVAFGGYIAKAAGWAMFLIVQVPKEVYQATFLAGTATLTLRPDLVWASQALYLALFGAFGNIILLSWVLATHKRLQELLNKMFGLGVPPTCALNFWGMLYFGALALGYQSQIFGFFAAVCLSGIMSFAVLYRPGLLTLHFHEKGTSAVVFGHLVVLATYAVLKVTGHLPAETALFVVGLEYYCTIAMGVGFLVGASPFNREDTVAGYALLFVAVLLAAVTGYFFFDLKVIGSILSCVAVLLALEWAGYYSYKTGFLFGTLVMGLVLYGCALLLEQYAHLIVLRLA